MTKRFGIILGFAALMQIAAVNFAHAAVPSFRSLAPENISLITQHTAGDKACGPTALLYAFKLGNKGMRGAYSKLPGATDQEKLKSLVSQLSGMPSQVIYHQKRLDEKEGMSAQDLFAAANDLLPGLQRMNFDRSEKEGEIGTFLKRVHQNLLNSIANGVPVMAIVVPYMASFEAKKNRNTWSEHNGHYVVITGVPDALSDDALSFSVEYLDPDTGKVGRANLYEEVTRSFWARREKLNGIGEWIHPEVRNGQREVASPYLGFMAPGLNLTPPQAKDSQRVVVTLVGAVGDFSSNRSTLSQN